MHKLRTRDVYHQRILLTLSAEKTAASD
jgi:hypothetical protein